jgi:hypothetical protein
VVFFLLDDPTRRSWTHHAGPTHVRPLQEDFDRLVARSRLVPASRVGQWQDDELQRWLVEARAELLQHKWAAYGAAPTNNVAPAVARARA